MSFERFRKSIDKLQIVFYNYIVYTIHRDIHKMGVETTSKGNTGGIIMDTIRLKARAKINLGLDVVRRREDGYHEVRMVMQMLKLYDQIDIEENRDTGHPADMQIYPSCRRMSAILLTKRRRL